MFPISDDNPRRHLTPYVNYSLIGACVLVWLWQASLGPAGEVAIYSLGMIPARLFGHAELAPELVYTPAWFTVLSSMFMHGGWLHLGSNMLYLWIFGDNIEDRLGHVTYLFFYLGCGFLATFAHAFSDLGSQLPAIGASGAIAGVLGAYLVLFPRAHVM